MADLKQHDESVTPEQTTPADPAGHPKSPVAATGSSSASTKPASVHTASVGRGEGPDDAISASAVSGADGTATKHDTSTESDDKDIQGDTLVLTSSSESDPLSLARRRHNNVSRQQMKTDHPQGNERKLKKYYTRQNDLIDQFLGSSDEERLAAVEEAKMGPRVRFAVNASFAVNFCLFVIQLYAAVSTGSLSLFATAADAFMDLVSSCVMFVTSRMAARPSIYKYPVGRTRIETIGVILFCALMTTVAVQLIVESGRSLGEGESESKPLQIIPIAFVGTAIASKFALFCYCFALRKYPAAHVFYIDHRNDLAVNIFGLIMSIVGDRFVWYLDPIGAICIGLLILFSWVSNAFEQVWLLVGKSAPRDFLSKVTYMTVTHDKNILKVDTVRAYHAGQKFYVEVDIIMDERAHLKQTHDCSQALQRKLEGLADVERAFVHVDYEDFHDVKEEHKPLYGEKKNRRSLKVVMTDAKKDIVAMISPRPLN